MILTTCLLLTGLSQANGDTYSPLERAGEVALFGQPQNGYFFSLKSVSAPRHGSEPDVTTNTAGAEKLVWLPWKTVVGQIDGTMHAVILFIGYDSYVLGSKDCPGRTYYGICLMGDANDDADVRLVDFDISGSRPRLVTGTEVLFQTYALTSPIEASDIQLRDMENGFAGLIFEDNSVRRDVAYRWDRIILINSGNVDYAGAIPLAADVDGKGRYRYNSSIQFIPADFDSPDSVAVTFRGTAPPPRRDDPVAAINITDTYSYVAGPGYSGRPPPGAWPFLFVPGSPMPSMINSTYSPADEKEKGIAWNIQPDWGQLGAWEVKFIAKGEKQGVCLIHSRPPPFGSPSYSIAFAGSYPPYENDDSGSELLQLLYSGPMIPETATLQLSIDGNNYAPVELTEDKRLGVDRNLITASLFGNLADAISTDAYNAKVLEVRVGNRLFTESLLGYAEVEADFKNCFAAIAP